MSGGVWDYTGPCLAKCIAQFVPLVKGAGEGKGSKNGTALASKPRVLNSNKGAIEGSLGTINGCMHNFWGSIRGEPDAIVDPQEGVNHVRGGKLLHHEGHEALLDAFEQEVYRIFAKVSFAPSVCRWELDPGVTEVRLRDR